jgi:hypothetical protein
LGFQLKKLLDKKMLSLLASEPVSLLHVISFQKAQSKIVLQSLSAARILFYAIYE